ncbi:MAG: hypothetical protein ABSH47_07445 [Bryobacteraceae bacterium]
MNTTYVGADAGRPKEQILMPSVVLVIVNAPEATSRDEVIQRLIGAGIKIEERAEIAPETDWPEEVQRQVNDVRLGVQRVRWDAV